MLCRQAPFTGRRWCWCCSIRSPVEFATWLCCLSRAAAACRQAPASWSFRSPWMTQLSPATTSGDRAPQAMGGGSGAVGRQSDVSVRLLNGPLVVSAAASSLVQQIASHAGARRTPEKSPHLCLHFASRGGCAPPCTLCFCERCHRQPHRRGGYGNVKPHPASRCTSRRACDFVASPANSNSPPPLLPSSPLQDV